MVYLQFNGNYPAEGYWDQYIVKKLLNRDQVFVIPGAYQATSLDAINQRLDIEDYGVVIITSDEENNFPTEYISHPRMKVYTQYNNNGDKQIPIGSPPNPPVKLEKNLDYMYAGQVNTVDREQCADEIDKLKGFCLRSEGFSQGLDKDAYNEMMGHAKIVPCPGGHVSPDSFRLYEALEAGCTPVIHARHKEYFSFLGDFPFPMVNDWSELGGIEYVDYSDWWKEYKKQLHDEVDEDLSWLQSQL